MSKQRFAALIGDVLLISAASLLALVLRDNFSTSAEKLFGFFPYLVATIVAGLIVIPACGLDRSIWRFSSANDYWRIVVAVVTVVMIAVVITFSINRLDGVARSLPILQAIIAVVVMVGTRATYRHWEMARQSTRGAVRKPLRQSPQQNQSSILVVGLSRLTETFLQSVEELAADHVRVIGLVGTKDRHVGRLVASTPVLGQPEDIRDVVRGLEPHGVVIDRIVVTCAFESLSLEARTALSDLEKEGAIELQLIDEQLGLGRDRRSRRDRGDDHQIAPMRFAFDEELIAVLAKRRFWSVKRAIDITGALALLVLTAPILIVSALAVAVAIGFPVAFWQQRPGLGGAPFRLYKLRTMRPAHDASGRRLGDDERASHIGAFLRRTRIDELPQLFNIIRGDMSFVGPRPLLPCDQMEHDRARLLVRPGLTGWAQVVGGRLVSSDDKAALDVWYVKNANFWLDVEIVLRTVPIVLFGERVNEASIAQAWRDLSSSGIVQSEKDLSGAHLRG
ncbi:MAG: sugar transferase [Pseudomonadota bacterium]